MHVSNHHLRGAAPTYCVAVLPSTALLAFANTFNPKFSTYACAAISSVMSSLSASCCFLCAYCQLHQTQGSVDLLPRSHPSMSTCTPCTRHSLCAASFPAPGSWQSSSLCVRMSAPACELRWSCGAAWGTVVGDDLVNGGHLVSAVDGSANGLKIIGWEGHHCGGGMLFGDAVG